MARGDDVTVIASRGRYLGGDKLSAAETLRGVRVVRPWATSFGKGTIAARLSDYLTFWGTAIARAVLEARPDVVLAVTAPNMIATGVLGVAALRRLPLVLWTQDVYPDIAVAFGVLGPSSPPTIALRSLMKTTYRASTRVVALSDGMRERLVANGAPPERVRTIQNWADGRAIKPLAPEANAFRREHGLEDRFVLMYSGNFGVGHEFETFAAAARIVEKRVPRALFLFIGDGSMRARLVALLEGLGNVRFLPYQPYESLPQSLTAADVHLMSLRNGLEGLIVPSKFYGALATGRPVFYVGPEGCEVTDVIRAHDLGWEGRPGDAEGLARAIEAAASLEWRASRGERARAIFEASFDRPVAVTRWRRVLAEAAG